MDSEISGSKQLSDADPKSTDRARTWRWLAGIIAVALVLRLGCFVIATASFAVPPNGDGAAYLQKANVLLETGHFGGAVPDVNRTPLYPMFCAVGVLLGGWQAIVLMQIVMDLVNVVFVFALGRRFGSDRIGLVAAGLYAIWPTPIILSCQILSETLFMLFLVPALLTGVWILQRQSPRRVWLLGLLTLLIMYVRPVGMVFVVAVAMAFAWRVAALLIKRQASMAGRWALWTVLYVAIVVAGALPWCYRNYHVSGYFGFSGQGPITYLRDWGGLVVGTDKNIPQEQAGRELWDQLLAEQNVPLAQRNGVPYEPDVIVANHLYGPMDALAKKTLRTHGRTFVTLHIKQSLLALLPSTSVLDLLGYNIGGKGTRTVLAQQGVIKAIQYYFGDSIAALVIYAVMTLMTLALYVFALRGLWRCVRRVGPIMGVPLMLCLLYTLGHIFAGGIATVPRYLIPVLPIFFALAAVGICRVTAAKPQTSLVSPG